MNALADKKCDTCGAAATVAIADTKHRAPTDAERVRDPEWKATYREVTGKHYFCQQHERSPVDTPMSFS